jgi:hypothetical protein
MEFGSILVPKYLTITLVMLEVPTEYKQHLTICNYTAWCLYYFVHPLYTRPFRKRFFTIFSLPRHPSTTYQLIVFVRFAIRAMTTAAKTVSLFVWVPCTALTVTHLDRIISTNGVYLRTCTRAILIWSSIIYLQFKSIGTLSGAGVNRNAWKIITLGRSASAVTRGSSNKLQLSSTCT